MGSWLRRPVHLDDAQVLVAHLGHGVHPPAAIISTVNLIDEMFPQGGHPRQRPIPVGIFPLVFRIGVAFVQRNRLRVLLKP